VTGSETGKPEEGQPSWSVHYDQRGAYEAFLIGYEKVVVRRLDDDTIEVETDGSVWVTLPPFRTGEGPQ